MTDDLPAPDGPIITKTFCCVSIALLYAADNLCEPARRLECYDVPMNHYRSTMKSYKKQRSKDKQAGVCPFCDLTGERIVEATDLCVVVPNLTKYDLWELHKVQEHLMVIPRRHVESLDELTTEEMLDIMQVIAKYERRGYNVYARGVGFVRRSVKHQHTHLIKVSNKSPKFTIFFTKPYWLFRI